MTTGPKVGPPSSNVLETELDGDISIYDPATEQVTVLNSTASDVWRLADGELTLSEITKLLASAYGVGETDITEDVRQTVEQLTEAGLLETP